MGLTMHLHIIDGLCRIQDQHTLFIGGIEFRLFHDRGETDDATWVYLPKYNGRSFSSSSYMLHGGGWAHKLDRVALGWCVLQQSARATCSSGRRQTAATRKRYRGAACEILLC